MKLHTFWLRQIHKWIGLLIGLQFVLWTVSGAMMALLDMDEVAGGGTREPVEAPMPAADPWPAVRQQLGAAPVTGLSVRPLLGRQLFEVHSAGGTRLFEAATGAPVAVDAPLARDVAAAAYAGEGKVESVTPLREISLAVRDHQLPIWRVDFDDGKNSSFYVSGTNGELLARRNDTWRLWDFFWMLHNMDYVNRTSFNHPLIIFLGFAAVWLAITGVYLLVRTGWRSDFKKARHRRS